MSHDWSLRLARPEDAGTIPTIEKEAAILFADDPDLGDFDLEETWDANEVRQLIRKGHCLVAHVGDEMAGFLLSQPFQRELHVWEMSVRPKYQRRGIGAGLIRAAQVDGRNTGFKALTCTTFRDLPFNAPFYERLGWEEITAIDAHPRLAGELAQEARNGLPPERRCAMICFLD